MSYAQYCRLRVHVGASNREVIKRAHKLIHKRARRGWHYRGMRHAWLRSILKEHENARELFVRCRF